MIENERLLYIAEKIEREGTVQLQELCSTLNSSASTIRRDFEKLEQQNILKRVHGGAVKVGIQLTTASAAPTDSRLPVNIDEKNRIAKKCAEIVTDGDFVFVDGGSTFLDLPRYLEGKCVTIVTHNDLIRSHANSTVTVIVIGGHNLPDYKMNVGPLSLKFLNAFHFDKAFIGCGGINSETLSVCTGEIDTAQVKEAAIEKSVLTYIAVDSSKIDVVGFYDFANSEDFTGIILPQECALKNATNQIFV